ncbi:hypothetical protein RB2501_13819 [Robiginitalea biformata HTCC2501]|uniref:Uncharacterized protein n=2 Tax=Robiginitalea TaxID=252306 RepID=A4CKL1_ROBBH|nr:hypothetical protein RB2501_13819 [Robiginitalea biformata HTCC2501]
MLAGAGAMDTLTDLSEEHGLHWAHISGIVYGRKTGYTPHKDYDDDGNEIGPTDYEALDRWYEEEVLAESA